MHSLLSSQTKCAQQKAALYLLMLTTMLLTHVVGKKSLRTSVPISHIETPVILFTFICLSTL